jgi:hypothetical protein
MEGLNFKIESDINFNKIRIESCIGTILSIKNKIKDIKNIDPVFMFQFNRLESIIPQIKVDNINENEVEKIENATNNLFYQMKSLFKRDDEIEVYEGLKH